MVGPRSLPPPQQTAAYTCRLVPARSGRNIRIVSPGRREETSVAVQQHYPYSTSTTCRGVEQSRTYVPHHPILTVHVSALQVRLVQKPV